MPMLNNWLIIDPFAPLKMQGSCSKGVSMETWNIR